MPTYEIFGYKNGGSPLVCDTGGIGRLPGTDGIGMLVARAELIGMLTLLNGCANETAELTEKTLTSNTNAKTKMLCLMHNQLGKTFKKRQRYGAVFITPA